MIKALNLLKKYSQRVVVDNLNFQINTGEIVGLLGPNGAGKTTTIRMMAGVLPPTAGSILINEHNFFNGEEEEKSQIGYLPENNPLYDNLTVEEFLVFYSQIKNISQNRDLVIKNSVLKLGLTDVYYRPLSQLSKGFRQRVGLAQALLSDPPILLLDEPTEGLDPNQRREIQSLISGFGHDRTVIICSHVLTEITKMCKRVIILNQGRLVADDRVDRLTQISNEKQIIFLVAEGEKIKESLEHLPGVLRVSEGSQGRFRIESKTTEDLRSIIFQEAKRKNWNLLELTSEKATLEEVFAKLTE